MHRERKKRTWIALSKPNFPPVGHPNELFHWSSDCKPFIILPSYPFVDDVINKRRIQKLR